MNQDLPLVSIVTPSYNKGSFIEETILSVRNQTYPHIEHIVVDGGSTDETLAILRKYSDSLTWISEPDEGQSDAINKGWRMAKGEILAYLNADDTYMPWAVQTAVEFFADNPDIGMVYGGCNLIDERGEVIGQYGAREFESGELLWGPCVIPQPAALLRRVVLDDVGYLDTSLHMVMDLDLWIRIGPKYKVLYVPRVLASFRSYPGGKTFSERERYWHERFALLDKTYSNLELPDTVRSMRNQAYSYAHFEMGLDYYSQRKMKEARRHLIKSVILSPIRLKQARAWIFFKSCFGGTAINTASRWKSRFIVRLGRNRQD